MVLNAREANPSRLILTRAHSDAEIEHLTKLGADSLIMGERKIACGMVDRLDMVHYDSPGPQRDVIDVASDEPSSPADATAEPAKT